MSRIATLFRRRHTPDIEALSALVDGQLDADASRATEAHVASCTVCSEEVDGMRRVKAMLAAMPELDTPRSFRLRPADVEAPERPAPGATSGAMRWAPALSGVAAALFLVVLGTDFATRDGGGQRQASIGTRGDSTAFERSSGDMFSANDGASESADAPAGAVAPPEAATGGEDAGDVPAPVSTACDAVTDAEPPIGVPDFDPCPELGRNLADPELYEISGTPLAGDVAPADDADTKQTAEVQAALADGDSDDGGNRTGFLVVEIMAGVLAAGAAAAYIVSRTKRSEG